MSITSTLLSSANYAILAYSGITNTGATLIGGGNAGSFPTASYTGLSGANFIPPAMIDSAHAQQAEIDALSAYNTFAARSFTSLGGSSVNLSVSGNGVNNSTYTPGNYSAGSSMDIPTTITLDAQGNPNAEFVFKTTASTLTLESGASVLLVNGALARNVVWLVGSSFTSIYNGISSNMVGNIMAQVSITLGGGALAGRALAGIGGSSGAVTIAAAESILVPAASSGPSPIPPGTPTSSGGSYKCLISQNLGASVLTAWPQVTTQGVGGMFLDLVQIARQGDDGDSVIVLNVDFGGIVHYPALNPTNGFRIGQYFTRTLGFPNTTLPVLMADAFTNPSLLDIIQVINLGGNISYWWDYLGVAHGS